MGEGGAEGDCDMFVLFNSLMFAAVWTWQSGPHDRISCSSQQKVCQ